MTLSDEKTMVTSAEKFVDISSAPFFTKFPQLYFHLNQVCFKYKLSLF